MLGIEFQAMGCQMQAFAQTASDSMNDNEITNLLLGVVVIFRVLQIKFPPKKISYSAYLKWIKLKWTKSSRNNQWMTQKLSNMFKNVTLLTNYFSFSAIFYTLFSKFYHQYFYLSSFI